jgi:hypothetical protein
MSLIPVECSILANDGLLTLTCASLAPNFLARSLLAQVRLPRRPALPRAGPGAGTRGWGDSVQGNLELPGSCSQGEAGGRGEGKGEGELRGERAGTAL